MAEPAPWPKMMLPPRETLEWLNRQRPADKEGQKAVFTLRWLVHAELGRTVPDPAPTADFTAEDRNAFGKPL